MTLPGHQIRRWASRVFSPLTMARVIEPMLASPPCLLLPSRGCSPACRSWASCLPIRAMHR
jgi:hypothetical protein